MLGFDEDIKLISTYGKVLGNISLNKYEITLGVDVEIEMVSLD